MGDEFTLRRRACEAMQAGRLPNRPPDRMWGGPGNGGTCVVCGEVLERTGMAFDLEFGVEGALPPHVNYHLHVRCFAAWEFERDNLAAPGKHPGRASTHGNGAEADGTGRLDVSGLRAALGDGTIPGHERDSFDSGNSR
jgi:hypothetical protein